VPYRSLVLLAGVFLCAASLSHSGSMQGAGPNRPDTTLSSAITRLEQAFKVSPAKWADAAPPRCVRVQMEARPGEDACLQEVLAGILKADVWLACGWKSRDGVYIAELDSLPKRKAFMATLTYVACDSAVRECRNRVLSDGQAYCVGASLQNGAYSADRQGMGLWADAAGRAAGNRDNPELQKAMDGVYLPTLFSRLSVPPLAQGARGIPILADSIPELWLPMTEWTGLSAESCTGSLALQVVFRATGVKTMKYWSGGVTTPLTAGAIDIVTASPSRMLVVCGDSTILFDKQFTPAAPVRRKAAPRPVKR
jgi:hypothetical protein